MELIWKDRKRNIFGLPLSLTKYELSNEKLIITTGFLSIKEEEIKLYRIIDVTLKRSFFQRIFGLGTIHCCSSDKSTSEFDIANIKNSKEIRDKISTMIEEARDKKKIFLKEDIVADEHIL